MLDRFVRPMIDPPLNVAGRYLSSFGVTSNQVTLVGFLAGVGACVAIGLRLDHLALGLLAINRVLDGLDGAVARVLGATDFGGLADIVSDFLVYGGFVFAFAAGRPEALLPAAFLLFTYMAAGGSFLAFAIVAARRNLQTTLRGEKGFYHAGGLAEGSETILFMVIVSLWPAWFSPAAWIFGAMCLITAATRVHMAHRVLDQASE